jgi:hypothetical protein
MACRAEFTDPATTRPSFVIVCIDDFRLLAPLTRSVVKMEYLDPIFGNFFFRMMHQRDRVNVRAISNLRRALRPPLDAIHDRAY